SNIKGLVNRHNSRDGVRNRLADDFFAVYGQNPRAAFAQAGAVILEIEHDGMFAGREGLSAFPLETFQSKQIVGKHRFALEQIETVTSKAAAERVEHAFCALPRDLYIGGELDRRRERVR